MCKKNQVQSSTKLNHCLLFILLLLGKAKSQSLRKNWNENGARVGTLLFTKLLYIKNQIALKDYLEEIT